MDKNKTQRFYLPELDGLRFFAFLLVFIHNAHPILTNSPLNQLSEHGWIGVDLFFCLSAFLLTRLLVNEYKQNEKINIKHFYIRRILRIWPLYFFYIAVCLVYLQFADTPKGHIALNLLGLSTFTYNFVYFLLVPSPILVFVHLWSISFEEQFYAVIPWVVAKMMTITTKARWKILLYAYGIGNLMRAFFVYRGYIHPAIYILPFTHFDSILGGIAIGSGLLEEITKKVNAYILLFAGVISNLLIFVLPGNDTLGWHLLLIYPLVGLGMSLILLSILGSRKIFGHKFLVNRIFIYLGKISYGLYIYHLLCFILGTSICITIFHVQAIQFKEHYLTVLIVSFCLVVIISSFSYFIFEQNLLKLKNRFRS
jgi:peptidoglycan/LPS O-acetylase OafA/YrhL